MVTARLAQHIASALARPLPPEIEQKAALHVLDTFAAMVSGTRLPAGEKAIPFVRAQGGREEALLVGTGFLTSAALATLCNGMLAHADETDDSHAASLTHPGCAVVPAALAVAERGHRPGRDFLRAVTVGYDVCARVAAALGGERFFDRHHSSHSVGGLFGAAAAAAALHGLDAQRAAWVLAYAVQQASGNACWRRDPDHVEKAVDFGGMPAHAGVLAAGMVAAGFTGADRVLEGTPGLFAAYPEEARPELATEGLGETYAVMQTAIKKWSVGSPIQAALDSLQDLMAAHALRAIDVAEIVVDLPRQSAPVVDNRAMPAVNLQHQMALLLQDGTLGFASGHDLERMADPAIVALRGRIRITPRPEQEFVTNSRQAIVNITLADGRQLQKRTLHVRGTPGNPMSPAEVEAKAHDLMAPVLGEERSRALIVQVRALDGLADMTLLRPLLCGDA